MRYDQFAFTAVELSTSKYFNFHDFWIDFGLRFGLITIIYLTYKLTVFNMLKGKLWLGVLFGLLLLNTTFATSGILLTALIVRFFPVSHTG